uniref:TLDc domain-containing protein n=1 Tax=Heligmosomoides polygyrus TaxID=6339 RepID=A0A183F4P7_HELPZ
LRDLVLSVFFDYEYNRTEYSSDIVSPMQMWYLQCCLPVSFFPKNAQRQWNHVCIFYISRANCFGVSTYGQEYICFGPFALQIYYFRHSATRFGGSAQLFEMSPGLKRFSSFSPIYCNFKIRSAAFGISFAERMKIDKEIFQVWGCAPTDALLDQQKLRAWQSKQAEKNKKVPLPGNWDDNPDKTILEMAGFEFSNERK